MKSPNQVRILGVSQGWELLRYNVRLGVNDCSAYSKPERLQNAAEQAVLDDMLLNLGLKYHRMETVRGFMSVGRTKEF